MVRRAENEGIVMGDMAWRRFPIGKNDSDMMWLLRDAEVGRFELCPGSLTLLVSSVSPSSLLSPLFMMRKERG
jgi:hypothetical protein